jgi:cell volume regulation protein A
LTDTDPFAWVVLLTAGVGLVAVLSGHVAQWVKVPAPALFLVGAAVAVKVVPALHVPTVRAVDRVVTVALVCILWDGGIHIGWSRFRSAAAPIAVVGVLGTFLTAGAAAALAHLAFGFGWYVSLLVATAVAPTDPAVVFAVLGRRVIAGRSSTILEGESGANDPVGIALMASLVTAGSLSVGGLGHVGGDFVLQMAVGTAVGVVGASGLRWSMRHVPLTSEGLYPLRTLAGALLLYGIATVAHGSGFLAVFVGGIVLGDDPAPYKREIERFHSALASLAEIVAFVALGLTVDLAEIARLDVWLPGLVLATVVAFVLRPVLVGLCLVPARLPANQRTFVLFAGLKGAVPMLLGTYLVAAHIAGARRLYGIIVVVVVFSVVVQGSLVPAVASRLRLPTRAVELEPWALGVRVRHEPEGVHRFTVQPGSDAAGLTVDQLTARHDAWVSLIVRNGQPVRLREDTPLLAGDDLLVVADPDALDRLAAAFEGGLDP